MLKKGFLITVTTVFVVSLVVAKVVSMRDDSGLEMQVKPISEVVYSVDNIPIEVVFNNTGDEAIRILNVFDNPKISRIFFSLIIRDSNGTPVFTSGGGKISLPKDSFKYIELKKGEKYKATLNLKNYIPKDTNLKADTYSIVVIYRNQYGENCFKGKLESNVISLNLN